ncbi:alanine racemase [Petrotoga sp. 9PWA.NaAc.5.4]|uniref:alanine racemase n=1 Tax=Petrotoga sp. 9PWA.NaAc.5.4 TaxID=1434328 RepID=UPI000CA7A373|nr:alanine racemase [Petrotoga sp. 9PWA.NaAc.5.4]PNR96299.1 hypothetical protein X924_02890 [Petrotoga sp. 9PWA.NaAc.5.4]
MRGRNTAAYINLDNYLKNLEFIKNFTKAKLMPVLKADAYGHGNLILSKEAQNEGYDMFCVAFLEEAIELLNNNVKVPILIFNYFDPHDFIELIDYCKYIRPTIISIDFLEKACDILGKDIKEFKFHINVDTGINRIGIKEYELDKLINLIKIKNIQIEGFYSHFANADEKDNFVNLQYNKYIALLNYIVSQNIDIKIRHISNSAGACFFPEYSLDYVRPGVATFGLQPSKLYEIQELKPVLELKSTVVKINIVDTQETVGYNRTFKVPTKMKTAVVPLGYADGYSWTLSNKACVLIKGFRCKILGRISMDQIVVDVTQIPQVSIGDEVVIIGKQGNDNISSEELAEKAGTINYEITSRISKRIKRIYIKGGKYFD